ncbi:TPA: aldose 1-epimerase, partial [Klebsiella pneumoniae]|nr:aldose 1-epimerase [Klebsiella pneumoniae]HDQ2929445.1 aldose 1-epimerase [Klebsiella pneumoniae]
MAEEWILENAHLRMCVSSLGGKVQSLFSRQYQAPVLYENPAGGMFPMLPLANRVAGNRFIFHGQEIVLPCHHADEYFFLHGDGWLQRWDIIEYGAEYCVLQLRRQHACGFDYLAQLRYQLLRNQLIAELTLTHYGEVPALYGCGFHPFFPFDERSKVQFQVSGYW